MTSPTPDEREATIAALADALRDAYMRAYMFAWPRGSWCDLATAVLDSPALADLIERAEKRGAEAALAGVRDEIATHSPPNCELNPDGTEDVVTAAYVEGLHDAWSIVSAHLPPIDLAAIWAAGEPA